MKIEDAGFIRRLRKIRALVLDVDGVLTDGGMYYGVQGEVLKKFNTKDGMGIRLVQEAGLVVAFVTGEETEIAARRAEKLKVRDVYAGVQDKLKALDDFLAARGLAYADAAYIGDDLNDLPPMERVNIAIAVADAAPAVLKIAHLVTERRGGEGAVREVCDAILSVR